jgi:hypothetical protein
MIALISAFLPKHFRCIAAFSLLPCVLLAQQVPIRFISDPAHRTVRIIAGGKPFTTFIYTDTLEKPVLYPIFAPDGELITRGFPLMPRPGEPVDHPHHLGLWFNYENVNGLDFWNNSYAIPAAKKAQYGWIRTYRVRITANTLRYAARWTDQQKRPLLIEHTTFRFIATDSERIIDRITILTAVVDTGVSFPDAKDGMLGLRVAKELQIPSDAPGEFIDEKGNITKVAAGNSPDINGNYLTGEGKTGDSAWGTRAAWCQLYGRKGDDTLSVVIIDHPANPGNPTYWHARGYGLFAANPLGQKIFSKGRQVLNFRLKHGESAIFRYRIVLAAGQQRLTTGRIRQLAADFARVN